MRFLLRGLYDKMFARLRESLVVVIIITINCRAGVDNRTLARSPPNAQLVSKDGDLIPG